MNDDALKYRYRNLYYRLSTIKNSVDGLKGINNEIKSLAKDTLKVNKKAVERESINNLNNMNMNVSSSISSTLSSIRYYM